MHATHPAQAAADRLHDLDGHLARYGDPNRLAYHLDSPKHALPCHPDMDMDGLAAMHRAAHRPEIATLVAALHDAEDAAADAEAPMPAFLDCHAGR